MRPGPRSARSRIPKLEALLEFLRDDRGFDFTGYKRASLERRIQRRMQDVAITSYSEYVDYLQFHPDEFTALFNTILINVTSFLRDREPWEALRERILPELIAASRPNQPIRVWSAGAANGAEAYSMAMLMAEVMGISEFRDRVKIYATDVDEDALAEARTGIYGEAQIKSLPPEYLDRWFGRNQTGYVVDKDLRRAVIFGRNDLVQDAPISRVDVLVCRNTLMYFNAETQDRVLRRFHFALKDSGVLFLGKAETLLTRSELFVPLEPRHRLFRKVPGGTAAGFGRPITAGARALETAREESLIARAFDAHDQAVLIVSREGILVFGNQRALGLFGLGPEQLGRPFRELDASVRPFDLRPVLDRVSREQGEVTIEDVEWVAEQTTHWRITVRPLTGDADLLPAGWVVLFSDVTATHKLQSDLGYANRQLETAYEELQSTVEELETTNEELQSTVEELETTNEELQSTNEELETTNEELHSTNDELQLVNDELSERNAQVAAVNSFLDSVLRQLRRRGHRRRPALPRDGVEWPGGGHVGAPRRGGDRAAPDEPGHRPPPGHPVSAGPQGPGRGREPGPPERRRCQPSRPVDRGLHDHHASHERRG